MHPARAMSRTLLFPLTLLLLALPACGDATGPEETLVLATINGGPLPGPYPDPYGCCDTFEVTAGSLDLYDDGTFAQVLEVRCREDLPPDTECVVTGDGKEVATGTYSRAEGYIQYDDGGRFQASFQPDVVTIDVGYPPSTGFFPRYLLEFRE